MSLNLFSCPHVIGCLDCRTAYNNVAKLEIAVASLTSGVEELTKSLSLATDLIENFKKTVSEKEKKPDLKHCGTGCGFKIRPLQYGVNFATCFHCGLNICKDCWEEHSKVVHEKFSVFPSQ